VPGAAAAPPHLQGRAVGEALVEAKGVVHVVDVPCAGWPAGHDVAVARVAMAPHTSTHLSAPAAPAAHVHPCSAVALHRGLRTQVTRPTPRDAEVALDLWRCERHAVGNQVGRAWRSLCVCVCVCCVCVCCVCVCCVCVCVHHARGPNTPASCSWHAVTPTQPTRDDPRRPTPQGAPGAKESTMLSRCLT
jgi:hypothetical protein